jgi:glucarate dehydratase
MGRFNALCRIAYLEGWQVCKHTHGEFGLAAAAFQHLMLAAPNACLGHQQTAQMMADDILTERIPIMDGPRWGRIERPGIGVELDMTKVAEFDAEYRHHGEYPTYAGRIPTLQGPPQ